MESMACTTMRSGDAGPAWRMAGPAPMESGRVHGMDDAAADLRDIRRCLDGEQDAFAGIVERRQDRVSSMMWRFTRDPVDHRELVQDVFVEAYRSLRGYGGRAPFEHWLSRIATRTGYKYWKRRQRQEALAPLEEWDGAAERDPVDLAPEQASERLFGLLAALPPRDRLVLTLRYFEDLDVAETARRTGWSETMVKVQTHRARRKLRTLLETAERKNEA